MMTWLDKLLDIVFKDEVFDFKVKDDEDQEIFTMKIVGNAVKRVEFMRMRKRVKSKPWTNLASKLMEAMGGMESEGTLVFI